MATSMQEMPGQCCLVCMTEEPMYTFNCCNVDNAMKICKTCLKEMVTADVVKKFLVHQEVRNPSIKCPFSRHEEDVVLAKDLTVVRLCEIIDVGDTITSARITKDMLKDELQYLNESLESRDTLLQQIENLHDTMEVQRDQLRDRVLTPMLQVLNFGSSPVFYPHVVHPNRYFTP